MCDQFLQPVAKISNRGYLFRRAAGPGTAVDRYWEVSMNAFFKTVAVTAVAAAALMGGTAVQAEGERYVLVSHAPDSDSWWNTIKNGLALAGEQMGVEVEYRNPPTGDLADMARIIEQAAASGPDGIITTLADPDVCPARSAPPSMQAST
jgi:ABC-type branched-subunit amino acid transport system substrate-binding protein